MTYAQKSYPEGAMRHGQYTITAKDVQLRAAQVCQHHGAFGYGRPLPG